MNPKIEEYLATYVGKKSMDKGLLLYRGNRIKPNNLKKSGANLASFTAKSETGYETYTVDIMNFTGTGALMATCSCPYNWGGACKHIAAALLELNDTLENQQEPEVYNMLHSRAFLPDLNDHNLQHQVSPAHWKLRNSMPVATILSALNGLAECSMEVKKEKFTLRFTKEEAGNINTACPCAQELPTPLCLHKLAGLLALRTQFGLRAFEVMRDWTDEKNKLLAPYGFTTDDNLDKKFEFTVDANAQLQMKVLDASIRSTDNLKSWWNNTETALQSGVPSITAPKTGAGDDTNKPVFIFAFTTRSEKSLPDMELAALTARYDPIKNKISHIGKLENLYQGYGVEIPPISPEESRLINIAKKRFQIDQITAAIRAAGKPLPRWTYSYGQSELEPESLQVAQMYLGKIWEQAFSLLHDRITVFSASQYHHVGSMTRVYVNTQPATLQLRLFETAEQANLECKIVLNGNSVSPAGIKKHGFWLLQHGENLFRFSDWKQAELFRQFGSEGMISVRASQIERFLSDFIMPLTRHFSVDLDLDRPIDRRPLLFSDIRIYLKEDDENLLFLPAFSYQTETGEVENETSGWEFGLYDNSNKLLYEQGRITIWERDRALEQHHIDIIQLLHPTFQHQAGGEFFHLPFQEVVKNSWLYEFFEQTKQENIQVFGFAQLKKFKHNPNRPVLQIRTSSGIDWFDLRMEISFGDQFVSLNDIKKALVKKQDYVQLADGSIGMLPEEWLEKYASLLKFGRIKDDTVQVSKLHFSIIDELYEHIDSEKVRVEIQEKKMKLLHFKEIQDIQLPKNSRAQLRDYQLEGVKWLKFLEEFEWGGCLADDMGLGKTLQVLTFLQMRKETNEQAVHLVVVPTTLIFNWQAEVEKFAPEMRIFVHRGIGRDKTTEAFRHFDIILTTYGTLRSDIEHLKDFEFDYIVLDESQAIKNPGSLVSKAVKLLRAKNRIVMTGTPVENNTFDLYSQMEFVNPGLLGAQDFFRTEFATPIDKHRDENAAKALRKLIYPFILKRTKDEVAKDLPDKTEMILFCELGKKQRKVYDTYREVYRQKIADKMALEGKEKAAFLILEGLLKLRQICDSPALLSDGADYGEDSAKLDEIVREIEENAGHHKILIFSQFLKMLDLIKNHLEKAGIPYEYLDGSTRDRAGRVRNFQDSEHCRVFLMSLKAGGVGINLTEADYVYLIDPWWNPAVEQQAIDRTHRIGQTKKVFAYKMICKDTIEEKILQLQDKKKGIAKELISTEQGFIKKLTKDDVMGLFS